MSAVAAPVFELEVTSAATEEIKKFISSEDDLPETGFAYVLFRADARAFNTA